MDETARPPERDQSHAREPANPPGSRPRFTTTDPATGQPGRAYEGHTRDEALAIAREVRRAFEDWRHTSFAEHAALMKRAAAVLRRRQDADGASRWIWASRVGARWCAQPARAWAR